MGIAYIISMQVLSTHCAEIVSSHLMTRWQGPLTENRKSNPSSRCVLQRYLFICLTFLFVLLTNTCTCSRLQSSYKSHKENNSEVIQRPFHRLDSNTCSAYW